MDCHMKMDLHLKWISKGPSLKTEIKIHFTLENPPLLLILCTYTLPLTPPLVSIVAEIIPSLPMEFEIHFALEDLLLFKLWKSSSLPYDGLGILAFSATTTCIPP